MLSLALLMIVMVTGMNFLNYHSSVQEIDMVLELLSDNKGRFPIDEDKPALDGDIGGERGERLPHGMSPEIPYESRYFTVELNEKAQIINVDLSRISAVDREEAKEYAWEALEEGGRGFVDSYRFECVSEPDGSTRVIFLDSGRKIDALRSFFFSSVLVAVIGYLLICAVAVFVAGRIIRPVADSYEKQKRFITDAGHEIKTPLSIINANLDLMELDGYQSESLDEIGKQTKRLAKLTEDLVYLAKMEERGRNDLAADFSLSEMVEEAAESFGVLAESRGRSLRAVIAPAVGLHGNDGAIYQLINILLDNAIKYSPDGSQILLSLEKKGRTALLKVVNATATPMAKDELPQIFERFYRTDTSRNSETGGHGIGLSIAKAIVDAHGGRIYATLTADGALQISAELAT